MKHIAWEPKNHRHRRWGQWAGTILLLAILVLAVLFWKPLGENTIQIDFGASSLALSSPDGSVSSEISYLDVESIELTILVDYGTQISGTSDGSCLFGIWNCERWGNYRLYVNTNVKYCLAITETDGSVTVANFGSENVTKQTATAFEELVAEAKASAEYSQRT